MSPIETLVPYPLAECMQRVEALHETPPSYAEVLSPSYIIKFYFNGRRRAYRTTVRQRESDSRSAAYRLERIQREARIFTFINTAQIDIRLEGQDPLHTRIIYQIQVWPVAKLIHLGVVLFGTGFIMLIGQPGDFPLFVAIAGLFTAINLVIMSTTFKAQTEILMSQLEQVLSELENAPQ